LRIGEVTTDLAQSESESLEEAVAHRRFGLAKFADFHDIDNSNNYTQTSLKCLKQTKALHWDMRLSGTSDTPRPMTARNPLMNGFGTSLR
jgi:hypothetical protein